MTEPIREIVICMGSSCFARGNEGNLRVIEAFLDKAAENTASGSTPPTLSGKCCLGKCAEGPNVVFDGVRYPRLDKGSLLDLLNAQQ